MHPTPCALYPAPYSQPLAPPWTLPDPLLPLCCLHHLQWNVRSNQGLPPIVYRYMRKFRGW